MIDRFLDIADVRDGSLLDAAILTDGGMESWRHPSANTCSNSHSAVKLFTAVCVAMLCEEGALSYRDRVVDFFPSLLPDAMDARWREVTVEHALTHTTGIDHAFDLEGDVLPDGGKTDYLTLTFALPLPYAPGTHMQYSDAAYYLLSRVIEARAGMTMEAFIRARLGGALGLRDFAIASCPKGHFFGGGCLYMRAADMVKLGFLLSSGGVYQGARVLREDTVRLMMDRGYALTRRAGTGLYFKTGAFGQCIVLSSKRPFAAAWHRSAYAVKPTPDRNDTLLSALARAAAEVYPDGV